MKGFSISKTNDEQLNDHLEKRTPGPVKKLISLGVISRIRDEDNPKDSLGNALLSFWKERLDNKIDPALARVALSILNAFCTSCSSEGEFSKAGRVITRDRMMLMDNVAEAQELKMGNVEIADLYCSFD